MTNRKLITSLTVGLAIFAGVTSVGYYLVSGIPEFAIYRLQKSIEKHNWDTFQKHAETDMLTESAFDSFLMRWDSIKTDEKQLVSKDMVLFMKPMILASMNVGLEYFILNGAFPNNNDIIPSGMNIRNYRKVFSELYDYHDFSKEKLSDSLCRISLQFSSVKHGNITLLMLLHRKEHLWKLQKLENLTEILSTLDSIEHLKK